MASENAIPERRARVEIRDGLLRFNGRAVVPFGGEVQYFRNRDPHGDAAGTQELWRKTLDRMAAAGMNHVTTYVPWDWHEAAEGSFRWDGDRDLDAFLGLAFARGFLVGLKPGPFITAEWPRGFGSFGAVPAWFRAKHPGALVKRPGGGAWTFDPLGGRDQTQPRYDAPEFLAAVRAWFAALAPIVRRYVYERPCLAFLQLDNETNLWWSDFDDVDVPGDYDGRQEHCRRYLLALRGFWEDLGIRDGDVLFTVNDSPFAIPSRRNLLADGPRKSSVALLALDTYPKGLPLLDCAATRIMPSLPRLFPFLEAPVDQPFQASFFARLFASHSRKDFLYAAEIQAMNLSQLFGLEATCDPMVTGQTLAQLFGSGMKGGSLYVMREGINGDGTLYGPAAPLALHGDATARWGVAARFARFAARHGLELAKAPHETKVVVVTHRALAAEEGEKGRIWSLDVPGVYGWLRMAGYDPAVADLDDVEGNEMEKYAAVVCLRPDLLPPEARVKLDAASAGGATLVEILAGTDPRPVGSEMPWDEDGITHLPGDAAFCTLPGARGALVIRGQSRRIPEGGEVFLLDSRGYALGAVQHNDWGRTIRIGANFTAEYSRPSFFQVDDSELALRRDIARALLDIEPSLVVDAPRVEAWRRGPYAFLVNHGPGVFARVEGLGRCHCAFTGEARDPRRVPLPEQGWAVLRLDAQ